MDDLTLVIGNKNYSSWSLRPWLLMRHFDIAFKEIKIPLYRADTRDSILKLSPSGLVPTLIDGDITVWDSLAICEYLHERYPDKALWPRDTKQRAHARSISAEMHAGFNALRNNMPMNCRKYFPDKGYTPETAADIKRITEIWRDCRLNYGGSGPMLFGEFTIADAMYAPVALRFKTYNVALDVLSNAYLATLLALPEMLVWISTGEAETDVIADFEPYEQNA